MEAEDLRHLSEEDGEERVQRDERVAEGRRRREDAAALPI
jgi:hypothetical protein